MSNKVLITGVSGFLGRHVEAVFAKNNYQVYSLKNTSLFQNFDDWVHYAESILEKIDPQIVVNVGASQVGGDRSAEIIELTTSNVLAPIVLASKLYENNNDGQFITIGTSWQWGGHNEYRPFNLYAASKQACDDYLEHYALKGLKVTSLTLYDTYSLDDKRRKIHFLIKNAITNQEQLDMTAGEQVINLVHVEDAAHAIFVASQNRLHNTESEGALVRWAIRANETLQVKDMINLVPNEFKDLFKLGGRPYRDREIFTVSHKPEIVPNWIPQKNLFNDLTEYFKK